MSTTLELYESMHAISLRMVDAAHANDWDRLVTLENDMTETRHAIERADTDDRVENRELVRRAELITAIIENNREVRRHVDPWMASTRKLLGGAERDRTVRAAYGALSR